MSFIVRGRDKPKACSECPCLKYPGPYTGVCGLLGIWIVNGKMPENCPLEEVEEDENGSR